MNTEQEKDIAILKQIDAYLNGEMSADERDNFWDFLIEHPDYYQSLQMEASLRALIKASDIKSDGTSPEPITMHLESPAEKYGETKPTIHSIGGYTGWIIAVAAVLVLVIGINLLRVSSPSSPANRVALLDHLDLISSIDMFDMESVPATRGTSLADDPLAELFDRSLMAAFGDEALDALRLYEEMIATYPDDPRIGKAYMNMGIIHYNLENYNEAAVFFARAAEQPEDELAAEKAWWFKANAELVTQEYEMARYSMYITYGYGGVYKRAAFRQLRILDAYLGLIDFEDIDPEVIDP